MSFTEKISLMLRDTELDIQQLLDLASIYAIVLSSHTDMIALAAAHKVSLAEVYWECVKAQRVIAIRVKQIKHVQAEGTKRTEMP